MKEPPRINLFRITRGACRKLEGPCPHTICRYNLTDEPRGTPGEHRPPMVVESCVFEAAAAGGMALEDIAARLGVTREAIRQIQNRAIAKIHHELAQQGLDLPGLGRLHVGNLVGRRTPGRSGSASAPA
jgi:Sigma-70, region 4